MNEWQKTGNTGEPPSMTGCGSIQRVHQGPIAAASEPRLGFNLKIESLRSCHPGLRQRRHDREAGSLWTGYRKSAWRWWAGGRIGLTKAFLRSTGRVLADSHVANILSVILDAGSSCYQRVSLMVLTFR